MQMDAFYSGSKILTLSQEDLKNLSKNYILTMVFIEMKTIDEEKMTSRPWRERR